MNPAVSATRLALLGATITLSLSGAWSAPAPNKPAIPNEMITSQSTTSSGSSQVASAEAQLIAAQAQLDRTLAEQKAGAVDTADVVKSTISLANARMAVATLTGKSSEIPSDLETIVDQRQELLKLAQARYRAGISSSTELLQAQSDASVSLARVQLYELVRTRTAIFEDVKRRVQAGIANSHDYDVAADALRRTQQQFDEVGK